MKCKVCKEQAVVSLRSHHTGFCAPCYLEFFRRQVDRGIRSHKLFTHDDRILVALSGGKDSLALMLELSRQEYNVTGLHIDLAIPPTLGKKRTRRATRGLESADASQEPSAPLTPTDSASAATASAATASAGINDTAPDTGGARGVVERFCAQHNIPLIVKEMDAEGLAIPRVKACLKRPICSACGKIKRYYFNKTAMDEGYTALATGHNLDDEVARLFSNTIRWDRAYLSDQGPCLPAEDGFIKKVKPLWRLTEFETANYAFLMGIEHHYAPCPYSQGASFTCYKHLWQNLEAIMPGRKLDFYQGFLERGRPVFAQHEAATAPPLNRCTLCGYPTSADVCGVCRIKATVGAC